MPEPVARPGAMRWMIAVAAISGVWHAVAYAGLRHDDAFITFQHARTLAEGGGFGFNPGTPVLGTTSPGATLLLALIYPIGGAALPEIAVTLGALSLAAQAIFVALLLRPLGERTAAAIGILLALGLAPGHPWLALETNLAVALGLAAVLAFTRGKPVACGALLAAAILVRSDVALLGAGLTAAEAWRRRAIPWRLLAAGTIVLGPWLVWATVTFGSPIPATLATKAGTTSANAYLAHYRDLLLVSPGRAVYPGLQASWVVSAATLAGVAVGALHLARRARPLAGWCMVAVLLVPAYAAIGAPKTQHWHQYPAELALRVLVSVGVATVLAWAGRSFRDRRWAAGLGVGATALCATILIAGAFGRRDAIVDGRWTGQRHARYAQVAAWIDRELARDATVLAGEVGTIGYLSRRPMIDAVGLINPSNRYGRRPTVEALAELVARYRPAAVYTWGPGPAAELAAVTGYVIAQVWPGPPPSTMLLRDPATLRDPGRWASLQTEAAAHLRR